MEDLKKNFNEVMVTLFIYLPITIVLSGFVTMKLWNWFVVPYFNAPIVALWMMAGLRLFVSIIMPIADKDTKEKDVNRVFFSGVGKYGVVLLLGYIFSLFI